MVNGITLIDKPAGLSSFGVVARVRWLLSRAADTKVKVGHTGTLDPFATGLIIVVVGTYCKRAGEFSKLDKTYQATFRLGQTSSTGDPEGEIKNISSRQPTRDELHAAVHKFVGTITQTPPIYSAIKVGGIRAYKLARAGQAVDMPGRRVHIYSIELLEYEYPSAKIEVTVSSGTYIRSLIEDIGAELGTGAYATQLRRTRVGVYDVRDARQLDTIVEARDIQLGQPN